jgi:hypothetical protein
MIGRILSATRAYFSTPADREPSARDVDRVAKRLCIAAGLDYDALPERSTFRQRKAHPEHRYHDKREARREAREYLIDGGRA